VDRGRPRPGNGARRRRPRSRPDVVTRRLRCQLAPLLALLALVTVLGACQAGGGSGSVSPTVGAPSGTSGSAASTVPVGPPVGWTQVALPDASQPVTLAATDRALLVGSYATTRPNPRLWVLTGASTAGARSVRLTPVSPYAFEARWLSVAVDGDRVLAVGGARGGAHSNVRWTVWSGTTDAVVEQPQPFEVFGGWGAGDLSGAAFVAGVPLVSGGWQSDRAGNDVSLWRLSGSRWNRQSSTGTPLGSTAVALNGARTLSGSGSGAVLAGSVTDLAGGSVRSTPAVWTSSSAGGPWTLVRLPATSPLAEAHAARCAAGRCLVVGQDGGRLAVWRVVDGAPTRLQVPEVTVGDHVQLPAPVALGDAEVVVAPGALLVLHGDAWSRESSPPGQPTASAVAAGRLFVVTADASGTGRLYVRSGTG